MKIIVRDEGIKLEDLQFTRHYIAGKTALGGTFFIVGFRHNSGKYSILAADGLNYGNSYVTDVYKNEVIDWLQHVNEAHAFSTAKEMFQWLAEN